MNLKKTLMEDTFLEREDFFKSLYIFTMYALMA